LGAADAVIDSGNLDPSNFTAPTAPWSTVTIAVWGTS